MFHVEHFPPYFGIAAACLISCYAEDSPALPYPSPDLIVHNVAISSQDENVSTLVNAGLQDLLIGYHARARIYLEEAIRLDEQCALAYCGLLMLEHNNRAEYSDLLRRLTESIEQYSPTPKELFYVETFLKLLNGDTAGAAQDFKQHAATYRADITAKCWSILLDYDSNIHPYDEKGNATAQQQELLKRAEELVRAHMEHPLAHSVRALIEQHAVQPSEEALASAHAASQKNPNPATQLLYGHFLYQTKQYETAADIFGIAEKEFNDDSVQRLSAHLYRATALCKSGRLNQAKKETEKFSFEISNSLTSAATLYLWEYSTLPLRLILAESKLHSASEIRKANRFATQILNSVPNTVEIQKYKNCLVHCIQAQHLFQRNRKSVAQLELNKAEQALSDYSKYVEQLSQQGSMMRLCSQRALYNCMHAIHTTKALFYPQTSEIWQQNAADVSAQRNRDSHILPPNIF